MSNPEPLKIIDKYTDEHGVKITVVEIPEDLRAKLNEFHRRMARAEQLLSDEEEFADVFGMLPFEDYGLIRSALSAYLRENSD